jgi:hypothetical protein
VLKDFLVAVSLANLCFVRVWHDLLDRPSTSPLNDYFIKSASSLRIESVAAMIAVLALAALLWTGKTVARRSTHLFVKRFASLAFMLLLFFAINGILLLCGFHVFKPAVPIDMAALAVGTNLSAALFLYLLWRWQPRGPRAMVTLVLVVAPFVLVTFSQAVWSMTKQFADKPTAPLFQGRAASGARVLWLVFDELEQSQTFEKRPADLKLPEFDRLRGQSIWASHAYPPASWTVRALPALITGRLVSKAQASRPDELMITFCDAKEPVGWSGQPSVFSRARQLGFNTALVGNYHPYCRLLSGTLNECSWEPRDAPDAPSGGLGSTMLKQVLSILSMPDSYQPFMDTTQEGYLKSRIQRHELSESRHAVAIYLTILAQTRRVAADAAFGLILVHWPVPHPPMIYDRRAGTFRVPGSSGPENSYLDNLALVDRTLGELRRDMEVAGLWEKTTVIVSSDHWLRRHFWGYEGEEDHRIPFLVKAAGQRKAIIYDRPFNTVLTHDLILAILAGRVSSSDDIVAWLDGNRTMGESPCGYQDGVD